LTDPQHILLVEDDPDIRRVTRATLQSAGYRVVEAENGLEGINRIREAVPDLVVLDVMMPEMNGAEFCRALVDDLKLPALPVLIVSSINEKSGLMRALAEVNLQRREFLKKPTGPVELKFRIARMLGLEKSTPLPPGAGPSSSGMATPPAAEPSQALRRASLAPRASSASGGAPAEPQSAAGPRLRVLIVDDDQDLLAVNKFTVGKDHEVATAQNGLDGLEMLDLFGPDFVLVDYNMPTMDGLEMVELMRRHPRFHHTPALFLTGNDERHLPRRAHEAGINLFLRKPIEPERLRKAIAHFTRESGLKSGGATPQSPPPPPPQAPPVRMALPRAQAPPPGGESKARLLPRGAGAPASAPRPSAPAGEPLPGREVVRLLIVDFDDATSARLKYLVDSGLGGRVFRHHVSDHREALANLARWEPDIILYNPRDSGMDGIAFFQLFKIKRINVDVEFAFAGTEFVNAELKYSRQSFGRDVLDLAESDSKLLYELQAMVDLAERKSRPKRHSLEELQKEDRAERDRKAKEAAREAKQREADRMRFRQIQDVINRDL
jgi:CheY-like chemotaxis protein